MKCNGHTVPNIITQGQPDHTDDKYPTTFPLNPDRRFDVPLYTIGTKRRQSLPDITVKSIRVSESIGDSKGFDFGHPYIGIIVWVKVCQIISLLL